MPRRARTERGAGRAAPRCTILVQPNAGRGPHRAPPGHAATSVQRSWKHRHIHSLTLTHPEEPQSTTTPSPPTSGRAHGKGVHDTNQATSLHPPYSPTQGQPNLAGPLPSRLPPTHQPLPTAPPHSTTPFPRRPLPTRVRPSKQIPRQLHPPAEPNEPTPEHPHVRGPSRRPPPAHERQRPANSAPPQSHSPPPKS